MLSALILALGLIPAGSAAPSSELAAPVRIEAAGKPIDTEIGHAAPFVCDFDGDGLKDLLVGQFGQGLLWIYINEGTNTKPKLTSGVKFKEGKEDGRVPSG
jgi:hypothetical protein